MSKLLYIFSNPKPESESYSLSVGREFLNAYKEKNPGDGIAVVDVYKEHIPYIDGDVLNSWGKLGSGKPFDELTSEEKTKVGMLNSFTDQFIDADKYVFVTPMWNFTVPPLMKAYIDTICIAGRTFKYTPEGAVGLLKNKKALHIQASGGVYSEGPSKDYEMGSRYIKAIMNFLGVTDVETIFVEGMAYMPKEAESIKSRAIERARELAGRF